MKKKLLQNLIIALAIMLLTNSCGNKEAHRVPLNINNIKVENLGNGSMISFNNIENVASATIISDGNGVIYNCIISSKAERLSIILNEKINVGEKLTIKLFSDLNKDEYTPSGESIAQSIFQVKDVISENITTEDNIKYGVKITNIAYDEVSTIFQYSLISQKGIEPSMTELYSVKFYNSNRILLATTNLNSKLFGNNQLIPISDMSYGDEIYATVNISGIIYTTPNIKIPK